MFSLPIACRRAVHGRIRAKSEAVWITDEIFSRALQRFWLIAKSSKRDASSVPGPMESRRRLGRRRMANLSEAVQRPVQDFGALWGIGGALDRPQWQWEAPSRWKRSRTNGRVPQLPTWIRDYEPMPLDDSPQLSKSELFLPMNRGIVLKSIEDEVRTFRESLKTSPVNRVQTLCDSFNDSFRQNLALGLVSEDVLCTSLQQVTEDIQALTTDDMLTASRCQLFYMATWEGIKACTVLRPVDLGSGALKRLLLMVGQLPSTQAVQILAVDIIQTACPDQLAEMEDGILSIVKGWLWGWTKLEVFNSQTNTGATAYQEADNAAHLKESVTMLAKSLSRLPQTITSSILYACTDHLVFTCFAKFRGPIRTIRSLRYSWVSVVANMPCVDENLLLDIWSRMDFSHISSVNRGSYAPSIPPLALHESCNLLLDFWISHGQIKAVDSVRATYEVSIQESGRSDSAGYLLKALKQHDLSYYMKARCLFRFLRRLEKPKAVYSTFRSIRALNMQLPAWFVAKEIGYMSRRYPRYALNIYRIYKDIRLNGMPILLYRCSDLFITMIKRPEFHTGDIWAAFGVPIIDAFDSRRDPRIIRQRGLSAGTVPKVKKVATPALPEIRSKDSHSERSVVNSGRSSIGAESDSSEDPQSKQLPRKPSPLPRAKVKLVNEMAQAFAQAEFRSPRVALRNVLYCALYLRRHREPLSPELTRALTLAGITRDLLDDNWIGRRKALWILDMVKRVEGDGVAARMEKIVYSWRAEEMARQQRLRREANPLRVGQID